MGGPLSAGKSTLREMLRHFSKGSSHGKSGAEMLKMVNPKQFSKYLEDPNLLFMKGSPKEGLMATDMIKDYATKVEGERAMMISELLEAAKNIRKADKTTEQYTQEMIEEMMAKGADRKMAEGLAQMLANIAEDAAGKIKDAPKITDEGILQLENIYKNLITKDRSLNAEGGRVGMFRGGIPKGLQAALRAIMSKYGDDAITTADKVESKSKVFDDFEARNPNPNRQMTDEEITEFADEFGLDPSEDYYNWDGTLADARRLLKESEDEKKYMYQQYKAGRLDPKSGEKGREKFLEKKLEEAELSGESKLITRDEIQELEDLRIAREMAPQMTERLELRARYPGITDDLLDSILIDDNPQRKMEVLATLDEAFAMMRKGKGPDEVLRIIKDMNRTKQADGGSIDGDVSLTVIKIPDISESGVESLFKRR